jgi:hypothetical protein
MAFTYDFANDPAIANVRLLISDTNPEQPIFDDVEIQAAYNIQASTFQSAQFWSGPQGRNVPQLPLSYFRVAAILLDAMANNQALLAGVLKLLDVSLNTSLAAKSLREGAAEFRKVDDESGAFMIIEQTNTDWSFRDRWFKQWMRQSGGLLVG